MVWRIVYAVTAKWLPQSSYSRLSRRIRGWFGRRILKSAGKNINIERGATFGHQASLGDGSGIGVRCELHGEVHIGADVMMAPEVVVYTVNHASGKTDVPMRVQGDEKAKPVYIGNDVWIGRRAMIMPGVRIGDGCIVAAGAIVTKDIAPLDVVAGVPARTVKSRSLRGC